MKVDRLIIRLNENVSEDDLNEFLNDGMIDYEIDNDELIIINVEFDKLIIINDFIDSFN